MRATQGSIGCLLMVLVFLPSVLWAKNIKIGVVVGNNVGHDPTRVLHYAEQDAQKFHQVLVQLGGFEPQNLHLLLGKTSTEVWEILRQIDQKIAELSRSAENKVWFVFYYSGHAEGEFFEQKESSLFYAQFLDYIKNSKATIRLAFVDSCRSGNLVANKGGRAGPEFDIHLSDEIASSGYAIVTSSTEDELSQESAEIRGSFFTHYLVSALRGAADLSADGRITLAEAYRYCYSHTVARTAATLGGGQHPMYDFQLSGWGEIVLTETENSQSVLDVESPASGRMVVLDAQAAQVLAEAEVSAGKNVRIAIPPGRYRVVVLSEQETLCAQIEVKNGQNNRAEPSQFQNQSLEITVPKGGLFRGTTQHRLGLEAVLRKMPLTTGDYSLGAALFYRLALPHSGWQPTARFGWSAAADAGLSTGYNDLTLSAGMGYQWSLGVTKLRAELLLGYEYFIQDPLDGKSRNSSGFSYLGLLGIEVPIAALIITLDAGAGGRIFELRSEGWVHRMDLQLLLGVGFVWGDE